MKELPGAMEREIVTGMQTPLMVMNGGYYHLHSMNVSGSTHGQ